MKTSMSPETYRDRVYGCWAGKCLAGAIGMPFEGVPFQPALTPASIHVQDVPNDDLELQLVWMLALERHGVGLRSAHLSEYWLRDIQHGCDEYSVAIRNLRRGILPPRSGCEDNVFVDGMGAAIRSEIWAAVFAGRPDAAAHFAEQDATVDHWGDGVWAEVFLATAESYLFTGADMADALRFALGTLPETTRLSGALQTVFELHEQGLSASDAESEILRKTYHHNFTDCVMNLAFIAYALLWGGGDFVRTVLLAVNCGRDTDCTAATCGAFLGLAYGSDVIPQDLMAKLSSTLTLGEQIGKIEGVPHTLPELVDRTVALHARLADELPTVPYPPYEPCPHVEPAGHDRSRWLLLDEQEHDIATIADELARTGTCPERLAAHVFESKGLFMDLSEHARDANTLNLLGILNVSHSETAPEDVALSITADVGLTLWVDGQRVMNHHSRQLAIPSFHRAEGGAAFLYPLQDGDRRLIHIKLYSCVPPLRCTLMFGNQFNDHLDGFRIDV